jgi:hypothetical protein
MTFLLGVSGYWYWWYPPVGVFIAIMALVGVGVPLFRDPNNIGKWEKAGWTLLTFTLVGLELRSIYLDREDHEQKETQARREQLERFRAIGDGIKKNIDVVTGGDTFCYILAGFYGTNFNMVAIAKGESPLHDVLIEMVDLDIERKTKLFTPEAIRGFTTSFPAVPFLVPTSNRTILELPQGTRHERNFHFNFYSMNGVWGETLSLRLMNDHWAQAIRVQREEASGKPNIIFEQASNDYPKVNGKIDW